MSTSYSAGVDDAAVAARHPGPGLHQAVAHTAATTPDRVAVRTGDRVVTYAELDGTAARWAAELAALGVGPGALVPILLPRSLDLVSAVLAVLRTGAGFALLDERWPTAHLRSVLQDLDAPVLIDRRHADNPDNPDNPDPAHHPAAPGTAVWTPPMATGPAPMLPPADVDPGDACCVFFTSGTTGRPKGVVVPHRAISRLFSDDTFARFDEHTVITLSAATPWDAFALELWGGLYRGGSCVVVEQPFLTPDVLRRAVATAHVTIVWLTSSLFNMIVDEDLDAFVGLGQVLVGGERLSVTHISRFTERHPDIVLTNGYGPVESTIFASTHRVMPMDHLHPGGIPLGLCVSATAVYVLDGDVECGRDEPGEICISGEGLAIGYLGDPELTATRFATVPIRGRMTRVYRTGDLGVWGSPGGLLEFLGRADRQVKVRGHRVEPAQIERAILRACPSIATCRVIANRTSNGDAAELIAFAVPRRREDPPAGLAELVAAHLPAYECPSRYVFVDHLPLNDRGKVDEAWLLGLDRDGVRGRPTTTADEPDTAIPARSPSPDSLETVVRATFAQVLGRSTVTADAEFFALGGSSLDAGRVCARLARGTGATVTLADFYRLRTPAALARWLDTASASGPAEAGGPTDGAVPLRPVQTGFLLRDMVEPAGLTNHCLVLWQIAGQVDLEALDRAVVRVHERHDALRASYRLEPSPHARVVDVEAPDLVVLPPEATLEAARARMVQALAEPFDPAAGNVWRPVIVLVGSGDVTLFGCSVHHVAFDGWSEAVLADDLGHAYAGRAFEAAPLPLVHASALWQNHLARTDVPGQVATLVESLRGVDPVIWPDDRAVPDAASVDPIAVERAALPASGFAAARAVASDVGATAFVALLALWGRTLHDVLDGDDLAVGVPVADRVDADAGLTIGCQISTVPVRLRADRAEDDLGAYIAATAREVHLAVACQNAPLADLVSALRPTYTGRTPIFQTVFALQDNRAPELELAGRRAVHLPLPYLDVPTELHCEIWPDGAGAWWIEITYRTDRVPADVARRLLTGFTDRISALDPPGPHG